MGQGSEIKGQRSGISGLGSKVWMKGLGQGSGFMCHKSMFRG